MGEGKRVGLTVFVNHVVHGAAESEFKRVFGVRMQSLVAVLVEHINGYGRRAFFVV